MRKSVRSSDAIVNCQKLQKSETDPYINGTCYLLCQNCQTYSERQLHGAYVGCDIKLKSLNLAQHVLKSETLHGMNE
jgi:hypothetical protein